jgi:hypothetical protein
MKYEQGNRDRSWRRFQADLHVKQQVAIHREGNAAFPFVVTPINPSKFRKQSIMGCNCRKRSKNRPHCGGGVCHSVLPSPVVLQRRDGDRQCREWMRSLDLGETDPVTRTPWIDRTW